MPVMIKYLTGALKNGLSPITIISQQKNNLPQELLLSHYACVGLFSNPWIVAHQAPLSMGFPWQEYWSGLPFPSPGDLPDPGTEP